MDKRISERKRNISSLHMPLVHIYNFLFVRNTRSKFGFPCSDRKPYGGPVGSNASLFSSSLTVKNLCSDHRYMKRSAYMLQKEYQFEMNGVVRHQCLFVEIRGGRCDSHFHYCVLSFDIVIVAFHFSQLPIYRRPL